MLRSVLTTILAAALLTTSATSVSAAEGAPAGNTFDDHVQLVDTLREIGVRVYFNPYVCAPEGGRKSSGFYVSQSRKMAICQDKGKYDGEVVKFTDNDLDTIRHESQHVIQDCIDGIGDNSLVNMFPVAPTKGSISLSQFVAGSGLSSLTLMNIFSAYSQAGGDNEVIGLEFEAFAVANSITAAGIKQGVVRFCSVNNKN